MELSFLARQLNISIILLLLVALLSPTVTAAPAMIPVTPGSGGKPLTSGTSGDTPSLAAFASLLPHGSAKSPVGVYVKNVLALRIFAQPAADPGYVTSQPDAASLFGLAMQYGTTGLLAHNYLAGQSFLTLAKGQQVVVILADGTRHHYRVSSVRHLQALSPWSPRSNFVDLDGEGEVLSASQLFHQVYNGADRVVFQTCIELDGNPVWGRLFVTAEPIEPYPSPDWTVKLPALLLESPAIRSF